MTRLRSISRLCSQCSIAFESKEQKDIAGQWRGHRNGTGDLTTRYHLCVVHIMMIPRNIIISVVNDQIVHDMHFR